MILKYMSLYAWNCSIGCYIKTENTELLCLEEYTLISKTLKKSR